MFLVGLTGGIGTGKSTVSKMFRDNGIAVIDADLIARQIVEPGKPAWEKIRAEFGSDVFKESGELDRDTLGRLIFDDIDNRRKLNSITHPEIHRRIYKEIVKYFFMGHNFIVLDLPLLFETGVFLNYLHKIICVTCEEDIQVTRLMDRNHLSEADAKKRIKAQMPQNIKCENSNFVIENSANLAHTEEQFQKILSLLQESNQHWKVRSIIGVLLFSLVSGVAWILNHKFKIFSNHS